MCCDYASMYSAIILDIGAWGQFCYVFACFPKERCGMRILIVVNKRSKKACEAHYALLAYCDAAHIEHLSLTTDDLPLCTQVYDFIDAIDGDNEGVGGVGAGEGGAGANPRATWGDTVSTSSNASSFASGDACICTPALHEALLSTLKASAHGAEAGAASGASASGTEARFDLLIALGGDGSVLRSSRLAAMLDVPILGLNFGHLGFLCNNVQDNMIEIVTDALAGDIAAEVRETLCIDIECPADEADSIAAEQHAQTLRALQTNQLACQGIDPHAFANNGRSSAQTLASGVPAQSAQHAALAFDAEENNLPIGSDVLAAQREKSLQERQHGLGSGAVLPAKTHSRRLFALNEITIARGASGRIFDFDIEISGDHVARMRGDGVVISSATGSSAYALSAGGPFISPAYRGVLVVPVAPHTLNSRAIVTAPHDCVEISLERQRERETEVSFFVDGDVVEFDEKVARVKVCKGVRPIRLLKYHKESFYKLIEETFFKSYEH